MASIYGTSLLPAAAHIHNQAFRRRESEPSFFVPLQTHDTYYGADSLRIPQKVVPQPLSTPPAPRFHLEEAHLRRTFAANVVTPYEQDNDHVLAPAGSPGHCFGLTMVWCERGELPVDPQRPLCLLPYPASRARFYQHTQDEAVERARLTNAPSWIEPWKTSSVVSQLQCVMQPFGLRVRSGRWGSSSTDLDWWDLKSPAHLTSTLQEILEDDFQVGVWDARSSNASTMFSFSHDVDSRSSDENRDNHCWALRLSPGQGNSLDLQFFDSNVGVFRFTAPSEPHACLRDFHRLPEFLSSWMANVYGTQESSLALTLVVSSTGSR